MKDIFDSTTSLLLALCFFTMAGCFFMLSAKAQQPEPDTPFVPYAQKVHHELAKNSFTMCVQSELMDGTKLPEECTNYVVDAPEVIREEINGVCIKRIPIKTWHRFWHFCPLGAESLTIPRNELEAETIILPPECHTITVKLNKQGQAEKVTHYHDGECHHKFENVSPEKINNSA